VLRGLPDEITLKDLRGRVAEAAQVQLEEVKGKSSSPQALRC
jgi:hypothetical protein